MMKKLIFFYGIRSFCDETILMHHKFEGNVILEIRDRDMNSKAIKILGLRESIEHLNLCVMGRFIIVYIEYNSGNYLVKFDKDLVEVKRIELQYKIFASHRKFDIYS